MGTGYAHLGARDSTDKEDEMFERFRRTRNVRDDQYDTGVPLHRDGESDYRDTTVAGDQTAGNGHTVTDERVAEDRRTTVAERPGTVAAAPSVGAVRDRQRAEFGGSDGTAIFFGWLAALGLAALLTAALSAAGTQLGLATGAETADATDNAETIGLIGAIALLVVLALAYYGGGYVAGRMARFDGGRQGFRVWLLGLLVTIGLAIAAAAAGSEWNVLNQLNLPRIPVDEGDVALGAAITLVAVLLLTMLAAIGGGKAGERYHTKVDRFGWDNR